MRDLGEQEVAEQRAGARCTCLDSLREGVWCSSKEQKRSSTLLAGNFAISSCLWGEPWLSDTHNVLGAKLTAEKSCWSRRWKEEGCSHTEELWLVVPRAWGTRAWSRIHAHTPVTALNPELFGGRANFLLSKRAAFVTGRPPQPVVEWESENPIWGKTAILMLVLEHLAWYLHLMEVLWFYSVLVSYCGYFQLPKSCSFLLLHAAQDWLGETSLFLNNFMTVHQNNLAIYGLQALQGVFLNADRKKESLCET